MSQHVQEVTDADFEEKVLKSDKLVVVDFWAPWCIPCKMLAPKVEARAKELAGKVLFCKVNVDEAESLVEKYEIQAIPTLLSFKNGHLIEYHVGGEKADNFLSDLADDIVPLD